MASKHLDPEQQNFVKLSLAGVDEARALLEDVLRSQIPPKDLFTEIQKHTKLLSGSKHEKLSPDQLKLCYIPAPDVPDYRYFDVTLLYKLIRNLCSTLPISQGWGQKPHLTDIKIGDDVERLRIFRNEMIGHAESSSVPDSVFDSKWNELEDIFKRIQVFLTSKGVSKRLLERLQFIRETDFGWQDYTKSESHLLIERMKISDAPNISLQGDTRKVCGESACFEISFGDEDTSYNWPIAWKRIKGNIIEQLNISAEMYRGSSSQQLVITKISKEDQGEYRATVSREENGIHKEIPSNSIYLTVTGDLPILRIDNATSEENRIVIHYSISVNGESPAVDTVVWTKDGKHIETNTEKYSGGQLMDKSLIIQYPSSIDIGRYTCEVSNAVGSFKRSIDIDVPSVFVVEHLEVTAGNPITIEAIVQSCPTPLTVIWQKNDGDNSEQFEILDITDSKYFGSKDDLEHPRLLIPKVSHEDEIYYRLIVSNGVGQSGSNTIHIKLIGDAPSLYVHHETSLAEKSVTLVCEISLPIDAPEVSDIFWTKDDRKIDIPGSGGKYTGGSIVNPSITIKTVNANDKGVYQCCASNSVGKMCSEKIHLGLPKIEFGDAEFDNVHKTVTYNATVKSIPVALETAWKVKQEPNGDLQVVDTHDPLYRGSIMALPHPKLVVNRYNVEEVESFQLEVYNFIGSSRRNTKEIVVQSSNAIINKEVPVSLMNFYSKRGSNVLFANLSDDLADSLPENKIDKLKNILLGLKEVDATSIKELKSGIDLLMLLQEHNLFTRTDVIFMQYLLKKAGCEQLYEKCIQYARLQRALCFFEKLPDNGFKQVQFHVAGDFEVYSKEDIQKIKETVVAMLCCQDDEVVMDGCRRANSFFVVLAVKEIFVNNILHMDRQYIEKLGELKVDYFILDDATYYTESLMKERDNILTEMMKRLTPRIFPVTRRKAMQTGIEVSNLKYYTSPSKYPMKSPEINKFGLYVDPPPTKRTEKQRGKEREHLISTIGTKIEFKEMEKYADPKQSRKRSKQMQSHYSYSPTILPGLEDEIYTTQVHDGSSRKQFHADEINLNAVEKIYSKYKQQQSINWRQTVRPGDHQNDSRTGSLKDKSSDINSQDSDGYTKLHKACWTGNNATIQQLLNDGADINLCRNNGVSPLFIASQNGHDSTVQLLLNNGADINLCRNTGASPLYIASQNGHYSTVQLLLNNGADINLCNKNGVSPLYIASQNGHASTVQLLLNNGADNNLCENEDGVSPLFIASENGHDSTVQLLLNNGADINLCKNNGVSPLYIASQNGHDSAVQLLLNNGADINLCKNNGVSPLYIASQNGHDSAVQLLLNNGADINLCNKNGVSPLHIASHNGHDSAVNLLLNNGADINLCENEYRVSPLYIACQNGHISTVQLLLNNGADINICKNDGASPLYIASQEGHDSTVQLLLNKGADINLCRNNGDSPLDAARRKKHTGHYQISQIFWRKK